MIRFSRQIGSLVLGASLFLAGCLEPMEPEAFVADTVPNIGCDASFRQSLFDNIFSNLSQGKTLPSADQLSPYLSTQLDKLEVSDNVKSGHLAQIKSAYLRVYEVLLRYKDQDLGLPGSYGHWLADIESGTTINAEQSEWAADLNAALKDLDQAAQVLESNCPQARPETLATPVTVSNDSFFLSVETLQKRGEEGQAYINERQSNAYLKRGNMTAPARIYTDAEEITETPTSPGDQRPVESSEQLAQNQEGEENLEPTPSNWTPLQAHSPRINIIPPAQDTPVSPAPPQVSTPNPDSKEPIPFVENLFRSYHPVFAGALKTMAVLYQSCTVLDLPLVDSNNAPKLQGLQNAGRDRVYGKPLYQIADQGRFSQTHYYLNNLDQSHDPSLSQCRNTRDEYPSMYVYSGVADVVNVNKNNESIPAINLFSQASSSGIEPGMDCSAFVSVSFQAAGLKFKSNGSCRAYHRIGSTTSLINYGPGKNNYNCLFEPQRDETNSNSATGPVDLAPGDIFTVGNYHTVIIGQTGYDGEIPDPFRLRRFSDISQCTLSNFQYSDFDFDIIHSSATRSQAGTAPDTGLGVARHHARSYFASDSEMGGHLRRYAVQACKRKFNPDAPAYQHSNMNILRHKAVDECMCPDLTLLYKESCLNSCPYVVPGN